MSFNAVVTEATSTTQFKASGLAGFGDNFFKNWIIKVIWDAGGAGAAPQGESRRISSYTSVDGTFVHPAFSAQLALTDKVMLIDPTIAGFIESLSFDPDLMDTTDLIAATPAISATSKPGAANYSAALTLSSVLTVNGVATTLQADGRLVVARVATRISLVIDSLNAGCGHVYLQCYVDDPTGLVAANQLFSEDYTTTGTKLDAIDTTSAVKPTIFALLKDGAAHTFYYFLWVDAGNAVVSLLEGWEGVGSCGTGGSTYCLALSATGYVGVSASAAKLGTGAFSHLVFQGNGTPTIGKKLMVAKTAEFAQSDCNGEVQSGFTYTVYGTFATDLNYVDYMNITLRG
jgi:hypothetical protein